MTIKKYLTITTLFSLCSIATLSCSEGTSKPKSFINKDKSRDFMSIDEHAAFFITECNKETSLANVFINELFSYNLRTAAPAMVAERLPIIHATFQHSDVQKYLRIRCENASLAEVANVLQQRSAYVSQIKETLDNYVDEKVITDEQYVNALSDLEIMHTILKEVHAEKIKNSLSSSQWFLSSFKKLSPHLKTTCYIATGVAVSYLFYRWVRKPKPVKLEPKNEALHVATI